MEINRPDNLRRCSLPLAADMLNHRGKVGFKAGNKIGDLVKPSLNSIQPGPQGGRIGYHVAIGSCVLRSALEHRIQVCRRPAESNRQRFQRPRATAPLNRMQLKIWNSCQVLLRNWTVYGRHRRWWLDGTWDRSWTRCGPGATRRRADWTLSADSTVVRAHQHAAGARKVPGPMAR